MKNRMGLSIAVALAAGAGIFGVGIGRKIEPLDEASRFVVAAGDRKRKLAREEARTIRQNKTLRAGADAAARRRRQIASGILTRANGLWRSA